MDVQYVCVCVRDKVFVVCTNFNVKREIFMHVGAHERLQKTQKQKKKKI